MSSRNPDKPSRCLTHRPLLSPPVVVGIQLALRLFRKRIHRLVSWSQVAARGLSGSSNLNTIRLSTNRFFWADLSCILGLFTLKVVSGPRCKSGMGLSHFELRISDFEFHTAKFATKIRISQFEIRNH